MKARMFWFLGFLLSFSQPISLLAQLEFDMKDTLVTECKGILYDNGGEDQNYLHNSNVTFTICLDAPGILTLSFTEFCVESGFDSLRIFLGPNINSPQFGQTFSGNDLPPSVSTAGGCITLNFKSDANVACTGFRAIWTTQVIPPVPPQLTANLPSPACSTTTMQVNLSRKMHCDSLYAGAFLLQGIEEYIPAFVTPINCINDSALACILNFPDGLNYGGDYTLSFVSNFFDACDSLWTFNSITSFTIVDCPIIIELEAISDSICAGNCTQIEAFVNGGDGNYTFTWSNALPAQANPQNVCPNATSTYTLTVDDTSPALPASASITITVLSLPQINASAELCQSDEPIQLLGNPAGGVWTGSGVLISEPSVFDPDSAQSGANQLTYTYPFSANFSCSSTTIFTITPIYPGLPLAACPDSPPFLLAGAIPAGGTWSGPHVSGNVFIPDTAGVFNITYAIDGCEAVRLVFVDSILGTPTSIDSVCQSADAFQFELQPFGGRWSGTGITDSIAGWFDPSEAEGGLHEITYRIFGCSETFFIYVHPIYAGNNRSACPQQDAFVLHDFYPPGGTWSGPGIIDAETGLFDPNPNSGAQFNSDLVYTHPNGCSDDVRIFVRQTHIEPDTLFFCNGAEDLRLFDETTGFNPRGGIWTGLGILPSEDADSSYFSPSIAGNGIHTIYYSINTCTDSVYMVVLNTILSEQTVICEQAPAVDLPLPDYVQGGTFSGNGIDNPSVGLFDPSLAQGGMHEIVFTSLQGCKDTIYIEVEEFLQAELNINGSSFCYIDTLIAIELFPNDGMLSGAGIENGFFNPVMADEGTHALIYSYGSGFCSSHDTVVVTVLPRINYSYTLSNDSICAGELVNIQLNAFGGLGDLITYQWSGNLSPLPQQIVSPAQTTDYTILISDGCTVIRDTIQVFVYPPIPFTLFYEMPKCYGNESFVIGQTAGDAPYQIIWDGLPYNNGDTLRGRASFNYTFEVLDTISGCRIDTNIVIPGFPFLQANFSINPGMECLPFEIREITVIDLSTGATSGTWTWGDGSTTPYEFGVMASHAYTNHGLYLVSLEVSDTNGCTSKEVKSLCILQPYRLFAPNAFTPNGDSMNDKFQIFGTGIVEGELSIFDRRGQLIWKGNILENGWDGTLKGRDVQTDVFAWVAEVKFENGIEYKESGLFHLIR